VWGSFFLTFPPIFYIHSSPIRATCLVHLLDLIFLIILCSNINYEASHYTVTSSLLSPNILLSTLFSNTLSVYFSFNARGQVSHPYRTTGNIIVSHFMAFSNNNNNLQLLESKFLSSPLQRPYWRLWCYGLMWGPFY
jgi:hypothetical protein